MPEHFETKKQAPIDPKVLKDIREQFAEELENRSARSATWKQTLGDDVGERVMCEEQVPRNFGTENLVIDLGHKLGLSEEQIVELKKLLLKEKS
ncbi:MAG TPA: hypothetical protein VNG29_00340 [Candidatus Paceibacterota bacterium]|nr:hypothetical protein [Candidatus Paceibacterota bacterium]